MDLAAIEAAPAPFCIARIWYLDPRRGGAAKLGPLVVNQGDDKTEVSIDNQVMFTLVKADFRGAWQWRHRDHYYLAFDQGGAGLSEAQISGHLSDDKQ